MENIKSGAFRVRYSLLLCYLTDWLCSNECGATKQIAPDTIVTVRGDFATDGNGAIYRKLDSYESANVSELAVRLEKGTCVDGDQMHVDSDGAWAWRAE